MGFCVFLLLSFGWVISMYIYLLLSCTLMLFFVSQKRHTPLHLAALSRKHLAAQLLIGHGADLTVIGGIVSFASLFWG